MNDLLTISNGQPTASSRDIAEHFGKRHDHVLRDIETLGKDLPNFGEMFFDAEIPDSYGRPQRAYFMNRDGFTLLAMGFTGKEALEWKVKYMNAFNAMEQELRNPKPMTTNEMFAMQAQINLESERKLAALEGKVEKTSNAVMTALNTFAAPPTDEERWRDEMNRRVRAMCEEYGLNYHTTIGDMYAQLEDRARVNLSARQKNLRERMRLGGAKYAQREAVSKLVVISQDAKLRCIYETIVREKQAQLAASRLRAI
nr:MAG TPA: regulatory protein [Bacteriophage sp.]